MCCFVIKNVGLAIGFVPMAVFLMQQPALGDTETPRVVLGPNARDLVVRPGMNAAGRDLRGCEFIGQELTGANFNGCNFYGGTLEDCNLKHASFRGAVFIGARLGTLLPPFLEGADFTDATMNGIQFTFYGGYDSVQLSPQQLTSTRSYKTKDLHQCVINGSWEAFAFDFRKADLRESWIVNGDFTKSDFTDARIAGARFDRVRLRFEQLASTLDFKQRGLDHVKFPRGSRSGLLGKWNLSGINLEGSDLGTPPSDADFTGAKINHCTLSLSKPQLYSTKSYQEGNLVGLRVMGSDLSGFNLSGMNLTGCFFSNCKFAGANFEDAVITGAWFISDKTIAAPDQLTAEQIQSTWNYKHGHMDGIKLPEHVAKKLNVGR